MFPSLTMPISGKFVHYPTQQALPPSLCPCWNDLSTTSRIRIFFSSRHFRVLTSSTIREWRRSALNCGIRDVKVPKASEFDIDCSAEPRRRKIVEHIFLLRMKADLSEEEEKDMLDFLYTSQYQMRGILAISLGRIANSNTDGFTHAVYMRFQKKDDLLKFYNNANYLRILRDHVTPHCYGSISVDYESEVEDDILPIFRRGEEFNRGVEFVLLMSMLESTLEDAITDALTTFHQLIVKFEPLIVQATCGLNFNVSDNEYTHCAVIRFPSFEAFEMFHSCSEFKDMWRWKFQPITKKYLAIHFFVDPVGTELM